MRQPSNSTEKHSCVRKLLLPAFGIRELAGRGFQKGLGHLLLRSCLGLLVGSP